MLKVYFVDDARWLLCELQDIVDWAAEGYEICGSQTNPIEAMKEILRLSPDLVISDVRMSEMDGLTLAKEVYRQNPEITFCFLSAYDRFEYAISAMEIGAINYLTKPIGKSALLGVLVKVRRARVNAFFERMIEYTASEEVEQINADQIPPIDLIKPDRRLMLAVFYAKQGEPCQIEETAALVETVYRDKNRCVALLYDADFAVLKRMTEQDIGIGLASVTDNCEVAAMLKHAARCCRGEFLTGKGECTVYDGVQNAGKTVARIENASNPPELYAILNELPDRIVSEQIRIFEIDRIYRAIVLKSVQFGGSSDVGIFSDMPVTERYESLSDMLQALKNKLDLVDKSIGNTVIDSILEDVRNNVADKKRSLSFYAERYGYNPTYLSMLFKKCTGKAFVDYVVGYKMERAKDLILNSEGNMNEIAVAIGYTDYFHFSKFFKKYTGMSPTEYKKRFMPTP